LLIFSLDKSGVKNRLDDSSFQQLQQTKYHCYFSGLELFFVSTFWLVWGFVGLEIFRLQRESTMANA
jgi:hypothetical protein